MATFPDGIVYVEAVRPVMERELGTELGLEAPAAALVEAHVPPGWAADIRSLPRLGPNQSRRSVKAFL